MWDGAGSQPINSLLLRLRMSDDVPPLAVPVRSMVINYEQRTY